MGKGVILAPASIWLILTPNVDHDERKILAQVPGPYLLPRARNSKKMVFHLEINISRLVRPNWLKLGWMIVYVEGNHP